MRRASPKQITTSWKTLATRSLRYLIIGEWSLKSYLTFVGPGCEAGSDRILPQRCPQTDPTWGHPLSPGEDQSEPPASDIAAGRPANSEPPSRPQGKFPASQGSARGKNDKRNWCRCGQNLVRCLPELQFLHPGLV